MGGFSSGPGVEHRRPSFDAYARVVARLYATADHERLGEHVMVYLASLLEPTAYTFALALQKRGSGPNPNEILRKAMERTPASAPVQLGVLGIATLAEIVEAALPHVPRLPDEIRAACGNGHVLAIVDRKVELLRLQVG